MLAGQFHFDPESYLRVIRAEVPASIHPQARVVGMDVSPEMLHFAAQRLNAQQVEALLEGDIGGELPQGRKTCLEPRRPGGDGRILLR